METQLYDVTFLLHESNHSFTCSNIRRTMSNVEEILRLNYPRLAQELNSQQPSPLHAASTQGNIEIRSRRGSLVLHLYVPGPQLSGQHLFVEHAQLNALKVLEVKELIKQRMIMVIPFCIWQL